MSTLTCTCSTTPTTAPQLALRLSSARARPPIVTSPPSHSVSHLVCSGAASQTCAALTIAPASIRPKPNAWLMLRPAPLTRQSSPRRFARLAVLTIMCCTSLQVNLGFASSTKAIIPLHHDSFMIHYISELFSSEPAAIGEEAEVPVCEEVQRPWRSVVITFLSPCLIGIFYFQYLWRIIILL